MIWGSLPQLLTRLGGNKTFTAHPNTISAESTGPLVPLGRTLGLARRVGRRAGQENLPFGADLGRRRSAPVWCGRRCINPSVGGQWQFIAQCPSKPASLDDSGHAGGPMLRGRKRRNARRQ
jgi:hypothetical protein